MLEKSAKNLESLTKGGLRMHDAVRARSLMREAFPKSEHGSAELATWAAYRKLKLKSARRARAIYNGEARRIDGWELEAIEHAALEQARRDYINAKNRKEALKQRLAVKHAHFHSGADDLV